MPKKGDIYRHPETGERLLFNGEKFLPMDDVNSGWEAAQIGMGKNLVENIANTPAALGEMVSALASGGAAAATTGARAIGNISEGRPANLGDTFSEEYRQMQSLPGFSALSNLPRPPDDVAEKVAAGVRWPVSDDPYAKLVEDEKRRAEIAATLYPKAFGVGGFGADAATILAARRPVARRRAAQSGGVLKEYRSNPQFIRESLEHLDPKMREHVEDIISDKVLPYLKESKRLLGRAGVKAGEAGLEGAYLATLHDGDPIKTAVLSSTTSLVGSGGLQFVQNPVRNMVGAFMAALVGHEILKAVGPGSQDFFASKDFAIHSIVAAGTLGIMGGLVGAGRLRGPRLLEQPYLSDAITAVPRTVTTSLLETIARSSQIGDQAPMVTLEMLGKNHTMFNNDQLKSLTRAMKREGKQEGAFVKEVTRLMKESPSFRRSIDEILTRRAPPEGAELTGSTDPVRNMRINTPTYPIERGSQ